MRLFSSVVLVAPLCFACSSSSTDAASAKDAGVDHEVNRTPTDAGHKDAARPDAHGQDAAGVDAAFEVSLGDSGAPPTPTGTAIETGSVDLYGVTDDGYVIYDDGVDLKAAPLAGGSPVVIASLEDAGAGSDEVSVVHDDVFVWGQADANGDVPLGVWTSKLASLEPIATNTVAYLVAASLDGTAIVYGGSPSTDGSSATLYGVSLSAPTASTSLVSGVDVTGACGPFLDFTGTSAPFTAVLGACAAATTDAGADGPEAVTAYPAGTWTPVPLATAATSFWPDAKGESVAISLASGQLEIASLSGAPAIDIDSATALPSTPSFYLSTADAFVLYSTSEGALKTSTLAATPTVTTLVASGAADIDAVSPNEAWTLIDQAFDSNSGLARGLSFASTSTMGAATALVGSTSEAGLLGDAFTSDGNYVIFMNGVTNDDMGNNVGTLSAVSIAAPTASVTMSKSTGSLLQFGGMAIGVLSPSALVGSDLPNLLLPYGPTDLALGGSEVLFVDNFNSDVGFLGQVDLHVVDLSTVTPSVTTLASGTTIMQGADPGYAVSPDRKSLVYTISFGGSTDGLYVVPIP